MAGEERGSVANVFNSAIIKQHVSRHLASDMNIYKFMLLPSAAEYYHTTVLNYLPCILKTSFAHIKHKHIH